MESTESNQVEKFYEKTFRFEFEYPKNVDFGGSNTGRVKFFTSEVRWVGGFPWTVELHYENSERTGNVLHLGGYFDCVSLKPEWKCKTMKGFTLISPYPDVKPKIWKQTASFYHSNGNSRWGCAKLCEWSILSSYAMNGRIMIDAFLKVDKDSRGGEPHPGVDENISHSWGFNFTQHHPGITDGVFLLDDGIRVHVCKGLLADCSPDFLNLINYQNETCQSKEEIPLSGVDSYEFIYLLHVLRPAVHRKPISGNSCWAYARKSLRPSMKRKLVADWNVEFLVRLSDRFDIQYVLYKCEKFLMKTKGISDAKKLLLVDKYPLKKLKDQVMKTFNTLAKLKELKKTEEFHKLSIHMQVALFDQLLDS